MGAGAAATSGTATAYGHLVDPNRTWYNNRRLIALNGWIVLLLVSFIPFFSLSETHGYLSSASSPPPPTVMMEV